MDLAASYPTQTDRDGLDINTSARRRQRTPPPQSLPSFQLDIPRPSHRDLANSQTAPRNQNAMLFFWSFDSCLVACPLSSIANDPIIKTRKRRRTVATAVVGLRRRVHPTPPQKVFAVAERSSASRYVCTCVCVFCVCMSSFSNGSKPPARALFMDIIPPQPRIWFCFQSK